MMNGAAEVIDWALAKHLSPRYVLHRVLLLPTAGALPVVHFLGKGWGMRESNDNEEVE